MVRHQEMNLKENQRPVVKAPKVGIEIKRIQVGMLGEQGGNSREGIVGEVSRVEMKRRRRMKRRSKCQKYFLFAAKAKKKNQIDLGWNKLT